MKEKLSVMFKKQVSGFIGLAVGGTVLICMGRGFWKLIYFLFVIHGEG